MIRKIILGLTAALVVGGTALAAAPANANTSPNDWQIGGTTTLNVGDVTYGANGQCVNAPVTVKINVPDDYAYLDFEYTSSYDGPTTWADEVYGSEVYSGTYSHSFVVCPEDDSPGSYMGYLDVTFYDYDGYEITTTHATDPFTVRAHHTSTMTTAKAATGAHGWMLRTVNRYDGHAWVGHRVNLQQKYSGSWHNIKSVWSNSTGRADLSVTPARGPAQPYRAVSVSATGVSQKVSPTYYLARR